MKTATLAIATLILTMLGMAPAQATHNGYKYAAPKIVSAVPAGTTCSQGNASIKVTWKNPTGSKWIQVEYRRAGTRTWGQRFAYEFGTKAQTAGATSFTIPWFSPSRTYEVRVRAAEYTGHALSKPSATLTVTTQSC